MRSIPSFRSFSNVTFEFETVPTLVWLTIGSVMSLFCQKAVVADYLGQGLSSRGLLTLEMRDSVLGHSSVRRLAETGPLILHTRCLSTLCRSARGEKRVEFDPLQRWLPPPPSHSASILSKWSSGSSTGRLADWLWRNNSTVLPADDIFGGTIGSRVDGNNTCTKIAWDFLMFSIQSSVKFIKEQDYRLWHAPLFTSYWQRFRKIWN